MLRPDVLAIVLFMLLTGCVEPSAPALTSEVVSPSASSAPSLFGEELEDDPCALLTPGQVAGAVGVSGEVLRRQEIGSACIYRWEGGEARLARVTVLESAERAQRRFEQSYRTPTPEERARGEAALEEELEQRREEGELSERQARTADGIGGVIGDLAAATVYESVDAIGDQAVYDGTVHMMETSSLGAFATAESQLHFRVGNLLASVSADLFAPEDMEARKAGPSPEVRQRNREVTLALGRALSSSLDRR